MEKHEEPADILSFSRLPLEIRAILLVLCFKNSVQDMTSLMRSNKSFYEARKSIVWKDLYYEAYQQSDEFDVDKPSHEIKLFLRYFLPKDLNADNNKWYSATILRTKYDNALLSLNENKTKTDRTGWQTVLKGHDRHDHPKRFKYKQDVDLNSIYAYGFAYTDEVRDKMRDIEYKFHLCFLELTLQRFMKDPTEYPISAIDFYHWTKRVNVHLLYSNILCSRPMPPALPEVSTDTRRFQYNKFNVPEPIFLDYDNVEYAIQPGREWGVYTNYACEGLFWGKELDELMKNKYKVDVSLYDPTLFEPRPNFRNFSDLTQ